MRALEYETDERLLIEAAQRNPRSFAALYEANFERVYTYIARRVHDRNLAEELTAEVFHQALANISRFEWRGVPFFGWLVRIAANSISDHWKRSGREEDLPEDEPEAAGEDGRMDQRVLLVRLLDELPEDQRTVLSRRFFEQKSIRDIAAELERSEGAIKQLQFRALQTLRNLLKD